MHNPIISLYEITYLSKASEEVDPEAATYEEKRKIACVGGWDAINSVIEAYVANMLGAFEVKLISVNRIGECLVVDTDLLKRIRDTKGTDEGADIEELFDLAVS